MPDVLTVKILESKIHSTEVTVLHNLFSNAKIRQFGVLALVKV